MSLFLTKTRRLLLESVQAGNVHREPDGNGGWIDIDTAASTGKSTVTATMADFHREGWADRIGPDWTTTDAGDQQLGSVRAT